MLLDWVLLLPILFPLIGAVLFALIAMKSSTRARPWLPIIFVAIEIILIAINAAPSLHRFTLSDWSLASFSIIFQMDGITWLLFLVMFVPLSALWLIATPRKPFDFSTILVLTSAMCLASSANLLTAYIAWTLLDVFLFVWRLARDIERDTALRALAIGLLSGFLLFAGTILIAAKRPSDGAFLVAIAFWARLGLYPFHYLLPTRGADTFDLWFARGIPLIAASNLWLHWSFVEVDPPITLIGSLAIAALLASIIWIWRAGTPESNSESATIVPTRAAGVGAQAAFALVPLSYALGGNAGVALALWLTLTSVFALVLFEIALRWRADNLNRWPRLIWFGALLSLAGLPLTPAFIGRIGLYVALWETNNGLVLLLVGIATLITLAPMWNIGFALKAGELREPIRIEYIGLAIIIFVIIVLALGAGLIAPVLSPIVGESYDHALDLVVRTNDVLGVGLAIVMLIVPVIGSYFLSRSLQRLRPRPDSLVLHIARLIDLDWLEAWLGGTGLRLAIIVRGAAAIAEENPTIWILFAAMWVAIFIMLAR